MKLVVGEKRYPFVAPLDGLLDHLIRIQEATGVGDIELSQRVAAMFAGFQENARKLAAGEDGAVSTDLKTFQLLVWLARLDAGEDVPTLADACAGVRRSELGLELDPEDIKQAETAAKVAPKGPTKRGVARRELPAA